MGHQPRVIMSSLCSESSMRMPTDVPQQRFIFFVVGVVILVTLLQEWRGPPPVSFGIRRGRAACFFRHTHFV